MRPVLRAVIQIVRPSVVAVFVFFFLIAIRSRTLRIHNIITHTHAHTQKHLPLAALLVRRPKPFFDNDVRACVQLPFLAITVSLVISMLTPHGVPSVQYESEQWSFYFILRRRKKGGGGGGWRIMEEDGGGGGGRGEGGGVEKQRMKKV